MGLLFTVEANPFFDEVPSVVKRNESTMQALRTLLRAPRLSAKKGPCVGCGAMSELLKMTVFFWDGDGTTEITLPVCHGCAALREGQAA